LLNTNTSLLAISQSMNGNATPTSPNPASELPSSPGLKYALHRMQEVQSALRKVRIF
jgi:hypothetical protein